VGHSSLLGVTENHRAVFDHGGVTSLADLLAFRILEYPVAGRLTTSIYISSFLASHFSGTFWHMCESGFVCEELLRLGIVDRLSAFAVLGTGHKKTGLVRVVVYYFLFLIHNSFDLLSLIYLSFFFCSFSHCQLASLALSRLSRFGSIEVRERLEKIKAFDHIQGWVQGMAFYCKFDFFRIHPYLSKFRLLISSARSVGL
jgi:hypothetical protein